MQELYATAQISLATPALMFPSVSLLLLAYTNRFLSLAKLVRDLSDTYQTKPNEQLLLQISSLRKRLKLIQWMQVTGVGSLLLSVVVMLFVYVGWVILGQVFFFIALIAMIVSLVLSVKELHVSNEALNIRLSHMETNTNNTGSQ